MRRLWLMFLLVGVAVPTVIAQGPLMPAAAVTSTVYDGRIPLLPKWTPIDAAISGDNTVVPAVSAKKIRVLAVSVTMTGTAVTIWFKSGTGSTEQPLTGAMGPSAGQTLTLPFNPVGWFESSTGELLNMELSGAQSVDGVLVYVEVD